MSNCGKGYNSLQMENSITMVRKLSLSTEKIELEVLEGKDETGSFVITSTNQVKMRGIIYSSNPRMECLTPQFEGEEVRIRYQFHSEGLIEGDIQKGEFLSYVTGGI